jgi:hypothetical protein
MCPKGSTHCDFTLNEPLVIFLPMVEVTNFVPNSRETISHRGEMKHIPIHSEVHEIEQNKELKTRHSNIMNNLKLHNSHEIVSHRGKMKHILIHSEVQEVR